MFQLRLFVHQRLCTAAEEILGEVEKVMTLALHEADVQRLKQEPDSQLPTVTCVLQISGSEPPLTISALNREEELQGTSSQPSTQEESNLSHAEVHTDLCIKDEQEEHEHDHQTQEMIFPSTEWEQVQPAIKASAEMQLVSSDGSEAESEIKGSDEEGVQNKGAQKKMRRKPDRKSSARVQTDFCVCPTCGQGFLSIAPFEKHMKIHKQEPDSQRPIPTCVLQISSSEPPLTTSALNREEELQGTSSQPSTQEESNFSQAEVQTDLCIKDEQEEHEHDRQTQEVIYPSTETEQDQPVNEASAEMQPVSSDGSEAESEIKGGGEEVVQNEGAQRKMRRKTDRTFSVSGQTDLHVCPMCGKGFWFISPLVKHMKKHKKINGPTKKLLKDMQRFLRRKDCNVCGKKFTTTHCLRLHSKIHAAIRDFKCQVCGITFCKRRNLISHLRTKRHKRRHEEDILNRFGTGQKRLWKCSCARY